MQSTGVSALDTTIQKTNIWLKDVMDEIDSDNRHRAYLALRSVLHSLRDRLPIKEATDLGAQLPMLVRGFYYDAWNTSGEPVKFDKEEFLSNIRQQFTNEPGMDTEKIAQAVFKVIDKHIASGEIEDIKDTLPHDLKEFWEASVVKSAVMDDPGINVNEKQQTAKLAGEYFDLAWFYIKEKPVLLIMSGLVGTGKTTIAQELAKKLGVVVITADVTRKQLAGIPLTEHRFEKFGAGIYSPKYSRETYEKMYSRAQEILKAGDSVIIDASFINARERLKAMDLARRMGADFLVVECTLSEEIIRERLAKRQEQYSFSDARQCVLESQKKIFERVSEVPDDQHIVIDTSQPVDSLVENIESAISVLSC